MSTVRRTNEQIRANKGRVDVAKVRAAAEDQIDAWKREDGIDDSALGPARYVVPATNVQGLRERLGLSQEAFASRYRLSLRTVQEWEQHRREPSEPARVLLYAIANDPKGLETALQRR
jgi:DNA-binding transcriptional regulator YiaG